MISSPLNQSIATLTGKSPAKVDGDSQKYIQKMLENQPWPPLDRTAIDDRSNPKRVRDLGNSFAVGSR